MSWKIPLFKIYFEQDDIDAVSKVIQRGTSWACGPEIEEFEEKIASFAGTKYALAFNSGTSALHALLEAHNIKGGEVIVPSFTFIATANAVVLAGGKPVFAEPEAETLGLDAEDVKRRITDKTKAIIIVHYGGHPARDIKKIKEIAGAKNLLLIEDAAEAMGAHINGQNVGTFGNSAIFSFCQNKIITTGEGGAALTDFPEVYDRLKLIRSHGRADKEENHFNSIDEQDYLEIGYNYRLSTLLSALGVSQIKKIERIIKLRREKADYLNESLSKIVGVSLLKALPGSYPVYQLYTIMLDDEKTRDELKEELARDGIMSKVYFEPIHLKRAYMRRLELEKEDLKLPLTEDLSKRVLTLPLFPAIDKSELDMIVNTIKNYFERQK